MKKLVSVSQTKEDFNKYEPPKVEPKLIRQPPTKYKTTFKYENHRNTLNSLLKEGHHKKKR